MYSPSTSLFLSKSAVTDKGVLDFFVDISSSSSDYGKTSMSSHVSCISISATVVTLGSPTFKSPGAVKGLNDNSRESYESVDNRVWEFFLKYQHTFMLEFFIASLDILVDHVMDGIVSLHKCKTSDVVCLGREDLPEDLFYFYLCLITNVHVWFPLDKFTMRVLCVLNITPTQLHPNSWAWTQSFGFFTRH